MSLIFINKSIDIDKLLPPDLVTLLATNNNFENYFISVHKNYS